MSKAAHNIHLDAWLGLGDISQIKTENPLRRKTQYDRERPDVHMLKIMRDPKNLYFTAKYLLNVDLVPFQVTLLWEMWDRPFPMLIGSRGLSKSFMLAVLAMLKMALNNDFKVVIVGAAFRQARFIFDYMEQIWNNAPVLRSITTDKCGPKTFPDKLVFKINTSTANAIPLGDGSNIRGMRSGLTIVDEFASVPRSIFENVISSFSTVSQKPNVAFKRAATRKSMMKAGEWTPQLEEEYRASTKANQIIVSGSADFEFKHFGDYWRTWKAIIKSKGDPAKLRDIENVHSFDFNNLDYRDFSVIRIPYDLIPEGFLEPRTVARNRAAMDAAVFMKEYGACFIRDTEGFFPRSMIEACVTSETQPVLTPSGPVWFDATLSGNPHLDYVMGIDPAYSRDNFTICILELHSDHRRIVHLWHTNVKDFNQRKAKGLTTEDDFYGFCGRKIRDLMKNFNIVGIGIDSQGGGMAVKEVLQDRKRLLPGEELLLPIIEPEKEKDTDNVDGKHIIEFVQFANPTWTAESNYGLRKDMQTHSILFPQFNTIILGMALEQEKGRSVRVSKTKVKIFDSLEDVIMEVEQLKEELQAIQVSVVGTGVTARERWEVPDIKDEEKKIKLKKDRYSALLIANKIARGMQTEKLQVRGRSVIGGTVREIAGRRPVGPNYVQAPAWWDKNNQAIGRVIRRGRV